MPHVPLGDAAVLLATLRDFFHVAVHSILFYRQLYPARTFLSATAFGVAVHQSRHPQVCAWIGDAVDHVMAQLAGGAVETVAVVVHAPFGGGSDDGRGRALPPGAVLERWVFDVRHLPAWPGGGGGGADALDGGGGGGGSPHRRPASARAATRPPSRETTGPRHAPLPDDDENGFDYSSPGAEDEDDDVEDDYNDYNDDDDYNDAASEAELDAELDAELLRPQKRPVDIDDAAPTTTTATIHWPDLHHQLRAAVQRLAQTASALAPLPPQCTFTMALEVGDEAELCQTDETNVRRRTAWVPEQKVPEQKVPEQTAMARGKRKWTRPAPTSTTTTIRTVDAAPFFMECWVEESAIKNAADAPDGFTAVPPPPKKKPAGKSVAFDGALQ